jgi:hypothetical protein
MPRSEASLRNVRSNANVADGVVGHLGDAVVVIRASGVVTFWSASAERL